MKSPLRVAVYCRVGNPNQLALDLQRETVCKYANDKGYNIEAIFTELWKGTTMEHVGLKQIMELAQAGKIDTVVTMNCSCLGHNTVGLIKYTKALHSAGVEAEFIKEGMGSTQLLDMASTIPKNQK